MAHAMGADYIEQDVVLSSDGIPVVLHDVYLDSTTDVARRFPGRSRVDGRFYAMDFRLDELRELRVHERSIRAEDGSERAVYPDRFPLEPALFGISTLAEEIDLIAGLDRSRGCSTGLYVELKGPNLHSRGGMDIATRVLEVLADKGYADRPEQVYLQCFDGPTLQRLRHELKTPLPLIQLIGDNSWGEDTRTNFDFLRSPDGLREVASYADGIGPWLSQIYLGKDASGQVQLSDLVGRAQALGLLVHPYTFRSDELPAQIDSFDELLDVFFARAGVDGIFTDFPDLVRSRLGPKASRQAARPGHAPENRGA
jgi:glycerophosphoryl diester phosphodiesterase